MKKVTGKWNIFAPENYARIYLAEEMGEDHVEWSLEQMAKDSRCWIDLTDTPLFKSSKESKTKAAGYASRICQMIAYAEGREGKSLTGGGGCIRAMKATKKKDKNHDKL